MKLLPDNLTHLQIPGQPVSALEQVFIGFGEPDTTVQYIAAARSAAGVSDANRLRSLPATDVPELERWLEEHGFQRQPDAPGVMHIWSRRLEQLPD